MAVCLCKICLNARLLFDLLVAQAKKDQNDVTDSIKNSLCTIASVPNQKMVITNGTVLLENAWNVN